MLNVLKCQAKCVTLTKYSTYSGNIKHDKNHFFTTILFLCIKFDPYSVLSNDENKNITLYNKNSM